MLLGSERSDLLQDGQLEQEISQMLLSYLTQKLAHSPSAPPAPTAKLEHEFGELEKANKRKAETGIEASV